MASQATHSDNRRGHHSGSVRIPAAASNTRLQNQKPSQFSYTHPRTPPGAVQRGQNDMIGPSAPAPSQSVPPAAYPTIDQHNQQYQDFWQSFGLNVASNQNQPAQTGIAHSSPERVASYPTQITHQGIPHYSNTSVERLISQRGLQDQLVYQNFQNIAQNGRHPSQVNPIQAPSGEYTFSPTSYLSQESPSQQPHLTNHHQGQRGVTLPYYNNTGQPQVQTSFGSVPVVGNSFSDIISRNSPLNARASASPTQYSGHDQSHIPDNYFHQEAPVHNGAGPVSTNYTHPPAPQSRSGHGQPVTSAQGNSNSSYQGAAQPSVFAGNHGQAGGQKAGSDPQLQNRPVRPIAPAVSRKPGRGRYVETQAQQAQQAQQARQNQSHQSGLQVPAAPRLSSDAGSSHAPSSRGPADKKRRIEESDDDSEEEYSPEAQQQNIKKSAKSGACAPCKRLKMKCEFKPGEKACERCKNSSRQHLCIVGPRKPRQPSNKREQLMAKIREKDAVIESLLKRLYNPNLLTPLSVDPARISPSLSSGRDDKQLDPTIIDWIEKAQASVRHNVIGGYPAPGEEDGTDEEADDGVSKSGPSELGSVLDPSQADGTLNRKSSSARLHALPNEIAPVGLLAGMALDDAKGKSAKLASSIDAGEIPAPDPSEDQAVGIERPDYFQPGPGSNLGLRKIIIERRNVPEILASGLITPQEVDHLFKIFFEKLNLFISILDEAIHTPATTFGRCPFLFTVVCAISSRYYTERPELYSIAMHFAKLAAASALIDGFKSVEVCQAYLLLAVYALPSRKWEEAREWLYLGLAIRMATDLNLHVPSNMKPTNEQHARELLNRTRVWLICYNLDRSTSAQLGKPSTIVDDWIIRNSKEWWRKSKYNHRFDLHLTGYTDMLRTIMAEFQQLVYSDPRSTNSLKKDLDFKDVALRYDDRLQSWKKECEVRFNAYSDSTSPQCAYRVQLLPFYVNYSRLVILSFAFQSAIEKGIRVDQEVVLKCLDAASSVIKAVVNVFAATEFLRYAPDGHFVFVSFASAFLLKMLRKEPEPLLDDEQRTRVIDLVEKLIVILRSPKIAVDERHTPMLYSKFLTGLLAKHKPSILPQPPVETPDSTVSSSFSATHSSADSLGAPRPPNHHHQSSPSIEIVPPQPDYNMHNTDPIDLGFFDPNEPHPLSGGGVNFMQSQDPFATQQEALLQNQTLNPQDVLHPPASVYNESTATSTIQDASTVQGGFIDMDYEMLVPMMAINNPNFWNNGLMPGFSWPSDTLPWAPMEEEQSFTY